MLLKTSSPLITASSPAKNVTRCGGEGFHRGKRCPDVTSAGRNTTQCLMIRCGGLRSSIAGPATGCSRDFLRWAVLARVTCVLHPSCPLAYFLQAGTKAHEPAALTAALPKTATIAESLTFQVCYVSTLEAELKTTNPK